MQGWLWIAVPRVAVVQAFGQHTRASDWKAFGQFLVDMFEMSYLGKAETAP